MNKTKLTFVALLVCLFSGNLSAQIEGTDGFLMSPGLEIGIHSDGFEGSQGLPSFPTHYRGTTGRLGFLANPQNDDWVNYDGDFFMPGAPENRFGIEVDGVTYFNSSATGSSIASSGLSNYQIIDNCKFLDWDGSVGGIDIHMTYKMNQDDHYYTVQVVLTNTTALDKDDVYFYKSLDPDNNMDLSWGFATVNTIQAQPSEACPIALVSAEDNNGWDSYIGLGGVGEKMRVSFGGFYVNDASDVWNGVGPYEGTEDEWLFSDQAISICHKDSIILAGESSSFEFVVVMNEGQVYEALLDMFHFTYDDGPEFDEVCNDTTVYIEDGGVLYETDGEADTIWRCTEEPSVLWVEVPGEVISEFNLEWVEEGEVLGTEAYTTIIEGTEADTAHIICYISLGDCFGGAYIANEYVVITIQSPEIEVINPDIICLDSIAIYDVVINDTSDVIDPEITYHGSDPDAYDDMSDIWGSPYVFSTDDYPIYVMMVNPGTECYDTHIIEFEFDSLTAGLDGTAPDLCNSDASSINLNDYLDGEDEDIAGIWSVNILAALANLDIVTGDFTAEDLDAGIYEFYYIVGDGDPCPIDSATITLEIIGQNTAGEDGSIETCSAPGNTVNLNDLLDGNDAGGTWIEITPTDGFNAVTGILDIEGLDEGIYVYNYVSLENAPCPSDIAVFTVIIGPGPTASFTFTPGSVYTDDTEVIFTNTSIGATGFSWSFGDGETSTDENPIHNYPAVAGIYEIMLVIENDLGCKDSLGAAIKVKDVVLFYIPNTFTPDGNTTNDSFKPVFESGYDPYGYHLAIYNRYGEIVFESHDATTGWDGTYGNKGIVESGVYTWSIEFKELDNDRIQQHKGHVTVLK